MRDLNEKSSKNKFPKMAWILYLSSITFLFIALIGKPLIVEGRRATIHKQSHLHTRRFFQHRAFHSKEDKVKQNPENISGYIYNPTPQEPQFEFPVKKSLTAVQGKSLGKKVYIERILNIPSIARPAVKHKRVKIKLKKKGPGKGWEVSDDFLAGSVKQSSAIENALSLQKANVASPYHEIPRPLEEVIRRNNPEGRATRRTIEILSEKTNPEEGVEEVSRFRSEGEEKMAETSFDGTEGIENLKNEEPLFRRTMPIVIQEKKVSLVKEKRSFQDENDDNVNSEFNNAHDTSATSYRLHESSWEAPGKRRHPADETIMLKNLIHQDTMAIPFGSLQEAKDEQNTINEVERISKQSSVLPENLHLPYMSGPSDNMGLDFSKMDISVGKLDSSENNNVNENEGSRGTFLKRHSVPATGTGHEWETRNRNQIPRHHIDTPQYEYDQEQSEEFGYYPKYSRFPTYYRSPEIRPIEVQGFHRLSRFPPIAPAILNGEDEAPREPIPSREVEPEDEPPPVSEYIQSDEPAPIPELPSLREIPPIPEIREPKPEDLNPKDTFGS